MIETSMLQPNNLPLGVRRHPQFPFRARRRERGIILVCPLGLSWSPGPAQLFGNHLTHMQCSRGGRNWGPFATTNCAGTRIKVITPEIIETLDKHSVRWNSIDCVQISYGPAYGSSFGFGEESHKHKPTILWIGVCPGTLANEDGSSLPICRQGCPCLQASVGEIRYS
jgi:hypothetical protein